MERPYFNFDGREHRWSNVDGTRASLQSSMNGSRAVLQPDARQPVLLTRPEYGGTLAAVRCLGSHGVPVTMAGNTLLAPARWSRYVTRWVNCPPPTEAERFFDWLVAFGQKEPGHVLYPTSDDFAWLFADRAAILSQYFHLYQPNAAAILAVADKKTLHERCVELGILTLPTAFPTSVEDAVEMARGIEPPLLLKPRTQVLLNGGGKGAYVHELGELPRAYELFLKGNRFDPAIAALRPNVEQPMLQSFRADAAENIYSVSGFIGQRDEDVAVRAAVKVLQRPRRLGVGLCFEEARVNPTVLDAIVRLSRSVGYFGVFEAEFVRDGDRFHLIDYNPRFYGQMGFDVARGLPLPYFTWLGALQSDSELSEAVARSNTWKEGKGYVYCDRFFFTLMLSLQRLSGWMRPEEVRRWRAWLDESTARSLSLDSIGAPDDPLPAFVARTREIYLALRHPRSFYRHMVVGP